MAGRWKNLDSIKSAPSRCAVYAIFKNGSCIYIGSTVDLKMRFNSHHVLGRYKDPSKLTMKWRPTRRTQIRAIESRLIRRLKPRLNIAAPAREDLIAKPKQTFKMVNVRFDPAVYEGVRDLKETQAIYFHGFVNRAVAKFLHEEMTRWTEQDLLVLRRERDKMLDEVNALRSEVNALRSEILRLREKLSL